MSANTVKKVTARLIRELGQKAATAQRRRTNYNFHESPNDPVQRLVVAMQKETYIRPHRHAAENKMEFAIAVQGRMQVVLLNNNGAVAERIDLTPGGATVGLEIPSHVWHTWLALDDNAVFFECKCGPYNPDTTNVFAPWSPPEGDPRVKAYSRWLAHAKIGERFEGNQAV